MNYMEQLSKKKKKKKSEKRMTYIKLLNNESMKCKLTRIMYILVHATYC